MRHRKQGRKLGRTAAHKKALLSNLATSLIFHERIQTTTAKAKELRPFFEPLVTLAKRGDLHARRMAARVIHDHEALQKLFGDLAERFKDRTGGYVRIMHLGARQGDNAEMSIIELVDSAEAAVEVSDSNTAAEAPAEA
jgi:large subunit ribosomal protein L17